MPAALASRTRDDVVRAAMLLRANTLAKGYSGARVETIELLVGVLEAGIVPRVPSRARSGRAATSLHWRISRCRSSARARQRSTDSS